MMMLFGSRTKRLDKIIIQLMETAMTLADTINSTQNAVTALQAQVTALAAVVAALPASGGSDAAVLAAMANVQTAVDAVKADLTPTPAA